jgi:nicotinamidase-related amidase
MRGGGGEEWPLIAAAAPALRVGTAPAFSAVNRRATMPTSPRRALIVIDVQNEYVDGRLLIEHPPIENSLAAIGRAMDAARAHGVPVIVVQNTAPAGSPLFDKGTHGWALHETVARRARDHYIEKRLPSAYTGTDLAEWLRAREIDTLVVCGYMTHNCVDSTVKHALHAGTAVEVLHDAIGSVPYANRAGRASAAEIHHAFCVVMQSRFAAVLSSDEWIEVLDGRRAPERDTIFGSNQRALEGRRTGCVVAA